MSKYFTAKVVINSPLNTKTYLLEIEPTEETVSPVPGQFYMIQPDTSSYDPLLKRPFSYMRKTANSLQFIYAVRGKGTKLMKAFQRGGLVSISGPFGNGYPKPDKGRIPLLIAGGTGIASILSLCNELQDKYLLYGARCKNDLLMLDDLEKLGEKSLVCTNDCSFGREGMVDSLLTDFIASHREIAGSLVIYACGPVQMLKSVAEIAAVNNIKGYASLEENMACGFGACLGCATKTTSGYQRVCKEGPVFPFEAIIRQ